jgi:hypothetical protein
MNAVFMAIPPSQVPSGRRVGPSVRYAAGTSDGSRAMTMNKGTDSAERDYSTSDAAHDGGEMVPNVTVAGLWFRVIHRSTIVWAVFASVLLTGCASTLFRSPQGTLDERAYVSIFPWYAEFCAVSEISKKPGFGAEIVPGGPGGHSVLYLNGVCRVKDAGYPVVTLCGSGRDPGVGEGVGLSVNDHYSNANWIATEGRDFVMHGDLAPGEPLTRQSYLRTQAKAKAMGILDGVVFHSRFFDDQPAGMSRTDFMYDMSIATDYAVNFGRDRYCARVPLDRAKMAGIVEYLNAVNAPYRSGREIFNWSVLRNNCAHLAHNALAHAGVWPEWGTDRPFIISVFDFPVPKNEFVNLMRRTNDMPIADPAALFDDATARAAISGPGWIVTGPGGLAEAERAVQANEVYNTDLRLIFYDEPIFGHYQGRWNKIWSDPRYTDLPANLRHFATLYSAILANRPEQEEAAPMRDKALAAFRADYYRAIAAEKARLDAAVVVLSAVPGQRS